MNETLNMLQPGLVVTALALLVSLPVSLLPFAAKLPALDSYFAIGFRRWSRADQARVSEPKSLQRRGALKMLVLLSVTALVGYILDGWFGRSAGVGNVLVMVGAMGIFRPAGNIRAAYRALRQSAGDDPRHLPEPALRLVRASIRDAAFLLSDRLLLIPFGYIVGGWLIALPLLALCSIIDIVTGFGGASARLPYASAPERLYTLISLPVRPFAVLLAWVMAYALPQRKAVKNTAGTAAHHGKPLGARGVTLRTLCRLLGLSVEEAGMLSGYGISGLTPGYAITVLPGATIHHIKKGSVDSGWMGARGGRARPTARDLYRLRFGLLVVGLAYFALLAGLVHLVTLTTGRVPAIW